MLRDTGYTTPEGHWLPQPLVLPDVRVFGDLLDYAGEWKTAVAHPTPPRKVGDNEIGPFCTVDLAAFGGPAYRSIAVTATDAVIDAVTPRLVTPDDVLSFRVIGHRDRGRALVILEHGYIIGGHWLAYIDPATVPDVPGPAS